MKNLILSFSGSEWSWGSSRLTQHRHGKGPECMVMNRWRCSQAYFPTCDTRHTFLEISSFRLLSLQRRTIKIRLQTKAMAQKPSIPTLPQIQNGTNATSPVENATRPIYQLASRDILGHNVFQIAQLTQAYQQDRFADKDRGPKVRALHLSASGSRVWAQRGLKPTAPPGPCSART